MIILNKNKIENTVVVKITTDELKKISYARLINLDRKNENEDNNFIQTITKKFLNIYIIKFNKDFNICCDYLGYVINECDLESLEYQSNNTRISKINRIKHKINKTK